MLTSNLSLEDLTHSLHLEQIENHPDHHLLDIDSTKRGKKGLKLLRREEGVKISMREVRKGLKYQLKGGGKG